MFCMNCGKQLPDGAKYCMICETALGSVTSEKTTLTPISTTTTPQLDDTVSSAPALQASASSNPFGSIGSTNNPNINNITPAFVPAMCPNAYSGA